MKYDVDKQIEKANKILRSLDISALEIEDRARKYIKPITASK